MLRPFMGASHQLIEDIAALRAIPNLVILSPADAVETKKIVKAALEHEGPIVLGYIIHHYQQYIGIIIITSWVKLQPYVKELM